MEIVSINDLQQDAAGLLARVQAGECLVVCREGRPVAELRPIVSPGAGLRPFGLAAGEFVVPDDFDAPLPDEILGAFEGR